MRLKDTGMTAAELKAQVKKYMIETYERMDFVADMFKVFLFVQIAVHHKEQGERREVGSIRRLYIGAMFPQPETATAVKADAPCGYVGSGRLHFQHDGLSGVPDESVEDASSQSAAA